MWVGNSQCILVKQLDGDYYCDFESLLQKECEDYKVYISISFKFVMLYHSRWFHHIQRHDDMVSAS